jgi:hypothetical protein
MDYGLWSIDNSNFSLALLLNATIYKHLLGIKDSPRKIFPYFIYQFPV